MEAGCKRNGVYELQSRLGDSVWPHFPKLLRELPKFEGPFDAFRLEAERLRRAFRVVPGRDDDPAHDHDTENVGVITQGELILTVDGAETRYKAGEWYHLAAKRKHAARFDVETSEIEFWFRKR